MILSEKDLKTLFWKNYNQKNRAVRYKFECEIREGNADLVTIEKYQDNFQINAFEFKLNDLKKAFAQAEANLKYVNKSWVVLPIDRKNVIEDKWKSFLTTKRNIGVMYVEDGGRWSIGHQPFFNSEIVINQAIINLMMKGV